MLCYPGSLSLCSCFQGHDGGWPSGSNQVWFEVFPKVPSTTKLSMNPISVEKHAEVSQLFRAEGFSLLLIYFLDLPPTQSGLESVLEAWRRCCSSERHWRCVFAELQQLYGSHKGRSATSRGGGSIVVIPSASVHSRRLHMQQSQ